MIYQAGQAEINRRHNRRRRYHPEGPGEMGPKEPHEVH